RLPHPEEVQVPLYQVLGIDGEPGARARFDDTTTRVLTQVGVQDASGERGLAEGTRSVTHVPTAEGHQDIGKSSAHPLRLSRASVGPSGAVSRHHPTTASLTGSPGPSWQRPRLCYSMIRMA